MGNDQPAHVADINAVGWQTQKFSVVFGNAKSAYADACMLDAGAVRIEQLGTDDAYIGLCGQFQHSFKPARLQGLNVVVAKKIVCVPAVQLRHCPIVDAGEIERPDVAYDLHLRADRVQIGDGLGGV